MPIHRLLNEDAVALVIASIPTCAVLSTEYVIKDGKALGEVREEFQKITEHR